MQQHETVRAEAGLDSVAVPGGSLGFNGVATIGRKTEMAARRRPEARERESNLVRNLKHASNRLVHPSHTL